jgi:hypothetical protein
MQNVQAFITLACQRVNRLFSPRDAATIITALNFHRLFCSFNQNIQPLTDVLFFSEDEELLLRNGHNN